MEAARQAINSPLLEDSRIRGSRGVLINITASSRLGLHEVNEACTIIREAADCDDVMINFGVILNEALGDAVKITVIATGFQPENEPRPRRPQTVVESRPPIVVEPPKPDSGLQVVIGMMSIVASVPKYDAWLMPVFVP